MTFNRRRRLAAFISLLVVTPLGFATKFYSGPATEWVRDSWSGIFYVMFWCLAAILFFPRARPLLVAAVVFVATSILEVLQLWHYHLLESIRATFIGATLLGTTFDWGDFLYYIIGALAGWAWVAGIGRLYCDGVSSGARKP